MRYPYFERRSPLNPCELIKSVMMRPQPLKPRMKRRKTVSVTPAIGARTVAGVTLMGPIWRVDGKLSMAVLFLDFNGLRRKRGIRNGKPVRFVQWNTGELQV